MDITSLAATPPAPGVAKPGNLYADLQSRALWLGVDPLVDSNGAVLISDIVALQTQITNGDNASKIYTDTTLKGNSGLPIDINGYAGRVHTHVSTEILDFNAAVTTVASSIPSLQWVPGMIMQWSGSLAAIGNGDLAGWALCDGTALPNTTYPKLYINLGSGTIWGVPAAPNNATHFKLPDFRDHFIIGAGNKLPGINSKNPLTTVDTDLQGAHTPIINGTALTWGQVGPHYHNVSSSGTTSDANNVSHQHSYNTKNSYRSVTAGSTGNVWDGVVGALTGVGDGPHHTHTVTVYGTTDYQGSGEAHTHGAQVVAAHKHTLTSNQVRDVTPFYAMAFIIKL